MRLQLSRFRSGKTERRFRAYVRGVVVQCTQFIIITTFYVFTIYTARRAQKDRPEQERACVSEKFAQTERQIQERAHEDISHSH